MTIDDPDAPTDQTVTVHRQARPAAAARPAVAPSGPIDVRLEFRRAAEFLKADKDQDAAIVLRRVVFADPGHASAWANLGVALRKLKDYRAAIACYRRSLELNPGNAGTWSNLGNALRDLERYGESLDCHRRALAIDPQAGSYHHNFGIALKDSGDVANAIVEFEKALEINPNHVEARWDLSLAQLTSGNYRDGFANYETRWALKETQGSRFPGQRWRGEEIPGKTLLVITEQGFGDSIMVSRFVPFAAKSKARVVFACQKELARLFQGIPGPEKVIAREAARESYDYHVPLFSLIGANAAAPAELPPPLKFNVPAEPPAAVRRLLQAAGSRLKVGIIWAGSVTFKGDAKRSTTMERFLQLAEVPGVQLFSMQKGPKFAEYEQSRPDPIMPDLGSHFNDFADTAATVRALDLVIMVDSAVAHLSGSLDVPVWTLIPYASEWRWLRGRDDTPWYKSMRLFRQTAPGDWDGVFDRLTAALKERVEQARSAPPRASWDRR